VGGSYTYPTDANKVEYMYDRGFHDCFDAEPNVPYRSVL
jgi:L-ascorbate 6-phosphate lactonase